jgi:hypothetical protein
MHSDLSTLDSTTMFLNLIHWGHTFCIVHDCTSIIDVTTITRACYQISLKLYCLHMYVDFLLVKFIRHT